MRHMDKSVFEQKFREAKDANQAMFLIKIQNDHLLARIEELERKFEELTANPIEPEPVPVVPEPATGPVVQEEAIVPSPTDNEVA